MTWFRYRVIWVHWEDTASRDGWTDHRISPALIDTIGLLIEDNAEEGYLVISLHVARDENVMCEFNHQAAIPYSAIRDWRYLI